VTLTLRARHQNDEITRIPTSPAAEQGRQGAHVERLGYERRHHGYASTASSAKCRIESTVPLGVCEARSSEALATKFLDTAPDQTDIIKLIVYP